MVDSKYIRNFAKQMKLTKIMHSREEKLEAFGRLLDVLDRLRKECPWDRKQTQREPEAEHDRDLRAV